MNRPEPPHLVFSAEAEAKTADFRNAAVLLRSLAAQVNEEIVPLFDDSASVCSGCGGTHYHNFQQRQMRARVVGSRDRLLEIAAELDRVSRDPEFLG